MNKSVAYEYLVICIKYFNYYKLNSILFLQNFIIVNTKHWKFFRCHFLSGTRLCVDHCKMGKIRIKFKVRKVHLCKIILNFMINFIEYIIKTSHSFKIECIQSADSDFGSLYLNNKYWVILNSIISPICIHKAEYVRLKLDVFNLEINVSVNWNMI